MYWLVNLSYLQTMWVIMTVAVSCPTIISLQWPSLSAMLNYFVKYGKLRSGHMFGFERLINIPKRLAIIFRWPDCISH